MKDEFIEEEYVDESYRDEVGGVHDGGVAWNPNGVWCGECASASCKSCFNEFAKKERGKDDI